MDLELNYIEINRASWNKRIESHLKSEFYDLEGFLNGKTSLNEIELNLLGDNKRKIDFAFTMPFWTRLHFLEQTRC